MTTDNENDNVILFNKGFHGKSKSLPSDVPSTHEEAQKKIDDLKMYHTHLFLEYYIPKMFEELSVAGFNFDKFYDDNGNAPAEVHKIECFLMETVRSTILAFHGIKHPFQKLANGLYVHEPETDTYQLLDAIYLDFTISDKMPKPKATRKKKVEEIKVEE